MKNLIKINLLVIGAIIFCNTIHAQQRASDKPFSTVLSEIKQQQAMRNKMLQQVRQTTPAGNGLQNNTYIQPANNTTPSEKQTSTTTQGNQQGINTKPLNKPAIQPRLKKQ